jgi:ubiquinone/menaquinone biosynthesis C-methylase UbiE
MRTVTIFLSLASAAWAQVAREANRGYETPETRKQIVQRLENPERLAVLRPAELVAKLEIPRGSTVVDLGTGTGTLLDDLSAAVGPSGRVIAEDIHPDFLDRARRRIQTDGLTNVTLLLGDETDPRLPASAAGLVVILDAYHHFDYPAQMLAAIRRGLRPGGRLAIVEYHKLRGAMEGPDPDFALTHIRLTAEDLVHEVESAGYKLQWRHDHAPDRQYIAVFQRTAD